MTCYTENVWNNSANIRLLSSLHIRVKIPIGKREILTNTVCTHIQVEHTQYALLHYMLAYNLNPSHELPRISVSHQYMQSAFVIVSSAHAYTYMFTTNHWMTYEHSSSDTVICVHVMRVGKKSRLLRHLEYLLPSGRLCSDDVLFNSELNIVYILLAS